MPPRPSHLAGERLAAVALHVARWSERTLAEHDPPLTVAQYLVLEAVERGVDAPRELARRAGVSDAAVSQLLRDLEQTGLVERTLSATDRRRHELALTRAGAAALASASALVAARIGGLLDDLPGPDASRLAELLGRVGEAVLRVPPPPRPRGPRPPLPPRPPGP
jgi:DNA-binding MarR family transcriptional regulator